jgi:hypothetical protein
MSQLQATFREINCTGYPRFIALELFNEWLKIEFQ